MLCFKAACEASWIPVCEQMQENRTKELERGLFHDSLLEGVSCLQIPQTNSHITIHLGLNTKGTGHATLPAK